MTTTSGFSATSTTDEVLTGLDLTGRRFLVTGASGGLGMAPLGALAGHAIGDTLGSTTSNKGSPAQVKETTALQGQYGHSGKLQKFDDVEEDVLHRLRQLSGMIRS